MGEPSQGLFSGVFSYVTREVGSFVTNATGGVITVNTTHGQQQRRPKKRVKKDEKQKSIQYEASSLSKTTMPGSLFPRSPSMAPTVMGDYAEAEEGQPGPSKRARHLPQEPPAIRHSSPASTCFFDATSSPPASPRAKGKQKAVEDLEEECFSEADEDALAMPPPPVPIFRKGKERAVKDTMIDDWMRGKERELEEEQQRWERDRDKVTDEDRERDKNRIKMLEEEVQRLREELLRRSTSSSFTSSSTSSSSHFQPPPPPPPPPPPAVGTLIRAPTTPTPNPQALFASARASLKHAGTPNEAPINPAYGLSSSMSGRRAGKPTVGLQPDKMADFLKEMKTVRLRKVGVPGVEDRSMTSSLRSGDKDGGEFSFSFSSSTSRHESRAGDDADVGNSSWQSDMSHILNGGSRLKAKAKETSSEVSAGRKRKRTEDDIPTRRSADSGLNTSRSTNSSFASTVSVASSSSAPSRPSSFTRTQQLSQTRSKPSNPTTTTTEPALPPPPPLSRRSQSNSTSNSASSPPAQIPPRSKSPSTSFRRTSTSSAQSENEAASSSYRLYTLPSGTSGPSRAWAPSALLAGQPPPPPNETPSLCSDLPEGSTSVDDDELDDGENVDEHESGVPHVVVSPETSVGVGIGRRRREIGDVDDVDMEEAMDEEELGSRRNEKRPRLSPYQSYNMGESSNSSTSPIQEQPPPPPPPPRRFSTPVTTDSPGHPKNSSLVPSVFSRRPPVSPMPVTPSPQRPRPPASRGRERERGRPRVSGEPADSVVVAVPIHDGESSSRSRVRSKSGSRSRPPTPHIKRSLPARDEEESEEEREEERESGREVIDVDADDVKLEDDDASSEDPLSLGQNTSAESPLSTSQPQPQSQSQSQQHYRLDLSHSSIRSMPSRIPVARSTSLKRNKNVGLSNDFVASASSSASSSQARPRAVAAEKQRQAGSSSTTSVSPPDKAGTSPSRRRTLDQELRDIVASRHSDEPDHYYEDSGPQPPSANEMRRSTLIAVGTRSRKKGYMAHGGGGGVPVFVGGSNG
ncbi:hypothetical protein V5O48_007560, partial [Marasmius crinis-equi]